MSTVSNFIPGHVHPRNSDATPVREFPIASKGAMEKSVRNPSEKLGWWRGVSYEIADPLPLKPSANQKLQNVYWRGCKIPFQTFDVVHSAEAKTAHRGFWRGIPCTFNVANRATVI